VRDLGAASRANRVPACPANRAPVPATVMSSQAGVLLLHLGGRVCGADHRSVDQASPLTGKDSLTPPAGYHSPQGLPRRYADPGPSDQRRTARPQQIHATPQLRPASKPARFSEPGRHIRYKEAAAAPSASSPDPAAGARLSASPLVPLLLMLDEWFPSAVGAPACSVAMAAASCSGLTCIGPWMVKVR